MQTALNTWVWQSYLQAASARGTIHRQSTHSCFDFIGASQLWEIEIYSAVQQTQELVTKHLKGNPINFVPPNKVKYQDCQSFQIKFSFNPDACWQICVVEDLQTDPLQGQVWLLVTPPEEPELRRMFCPKSELTQNFFFPILLIF